jgi:hypothetical protein
LDTLIAGPTTAGTDWLSGQRNEMASTSLEGERMTTSPRWPLTSTLGSPFAALVPLKAVRSVLV